MVEGGSSDDYRQVKTMLYARPDLMHRVLGVNADAVAAYLNAQIDAGAQAVMVFDSWGGVLADGAFQTFSLAYTARVLRQLKRTGADGRVVPRIVFTKGGGPWLPDMAAALECDALGLDWTASLTRARRELERALARIRLTFQEYFEKLTEDISWGKPLAALLGALKVQRELEIPSIGGKDSMSGTFNDISVPPALISFAVTTAKADRQ